MNRRQFLKLAAGATGFLACPSALRAQMEKVTLPLKRYGKAELKKLKFTFHPQRFPDGSYVPHHYEYGKGMMQGLKQHGIEATFAEFNEPCGSDISMMWSWKQPKVVEDAHRRGAHVLIMEHGFIQPRFEWVSLAFDGFNGQGTFIKAADNGERWQKYFAHLLKPWREDKTGYALVMGEWPNGVWLTDDIFHAWAEQSVKTLAGQGMEVTYRPHPSVKNIADREKTPLYIPEGARLLAGTLEEALAGAACCITHSSTVAVESVLAGVPTTSAFDGSIAWPVTSHSLDNVFYTPDRQPWCHDMSWRQWNFDEVRNGTAWDYVQQCILI